jgi:hypothetical protein
MSEEKKDIELAKVLTADETAEILADKKISLAELIDLQLAAIEQKAKDLLAKVNLPGNIPTHKIHPIVCREPSGIIAIGYLKEPNLQAKMAMLDMALQQPFSCAEQLYDTYIIKDESDARMYDKQPENDAFYLTGLDVTGKMVQMYSNAFKKK